MASPQRRLRAVYCFVVLFLLGLVPASGLSRQLGSTIALESPACLAGPHPFGSALIRTVIVSQVDLCDRVIQGTDGVTKKPAAVAICAHAVVTGRNGLADIRSGDAVMVRAYMDSSGRPIANELIANLFVAIAVLGPRIGNYLTLSIRNDQALQPVARLYPNYTGVLPKSGTIDPKTRISGDGRMLNAAALIPGRVVKVYGYKPPASISVALYRIEILRHKPVSY